MVQIGCTFESTLQYLYYFDCINCNKRGYNCTFVCSVEKEMDNHLKVVKFPDFVRFHYLAQRWVDLDLNIEIHAVVEMDRLLRYNQGCV